MSRGDFFSAIVAFHKNSCTFVLQVYCTMNYCTVQMFFFSGVTNGIGLGLHENYVI